MEQSIAQLHCGMNDFPNKMKELRRLRTATMMEKCSGKNQVIVCPKPRRQHLRLLIGNRLSGRHPVELANITTLKNFTLEYKQVVGVLPPGLGTCPI